MHGQMTSASSRRFALPLEKPAVTRTSCQTLQVIDGAYSVTERTRRFCEATAGITGIFEGLRRVFVNLLSNSLDDLGPNGHIELRSSAYRSQADGSRCIRISVADNGKRIARPQLAGVFEPFFTPKGELGTGLGLWVTK
jgi:signal transduction histidine kinase